MKRRLIALGLISPLFLLVICMAALLLAGAVVWLLSGPEEQAKIIRIIPLAPLPTFEVAGPVETGQAVIEPVEPSSVEAPPASVTQTENQPPVARQELSLTPQEIEQALGFSLPAGSVNSVTQEGLATRLVIPKLNLDRQVVISPIENQTWKVDHLGQSVGHLEGTASPGSNSNLVLAAHVTLAAGVYGPFAGLAQLGPGDVIYVYKGEQMFQYVVDSYQIVDRTSIEVTYPSETGQVTLITCNNWNHELGRYQDRLVVKGHLVES